MLWCLEARKQVDQEGMMWQVHSLKDALLTHQTRWEEDKEKKDQWSERWEGTESRLKWKINDASFVCISVDRRKNAEPTYEL